MSQYHVMDYGSPVELAYTWEQVITITGIVSNSIPNSPSMKKPDGW